jgi:hypothetical protein
MLAPHSRLLIVVGLGLATLLGVFVWRRQNSARAMGGAISIPKVAWLCYTVFTWGMLCPILALDRSVSPWARLVVGAFALSMWIRGIAEVPMLYVWKNWRPPIGIAHDLVSAALVVGALAWTRAEWMPLRRAEDGWMLAFALVLVVAVLVEACYAALFERAVAGATTGDDGVWYASPEDPRFRFINRLTATLNAPLFAFLIAFLAVAFGGIPVAPR